MRACMWLPVVLTLCAISVDVFAIRIYKSRKKAMAMLSGAETDSLHYFSSCDQSTNYEACEMAIDNQFSQSVTQCSITDTEKSPWWRGYLENPMYVSRVYILNSEWLRRDEKDGLLEFSISGNGHVCHTHAGGNDSFESKTFPCDILAENIEIKSNIQDSVLSLCEVQVYGAILKFPAILEEPAQLSWETCSHSTTDKSHHCWYAFDENLNQDAGSGFCSMTQQGKYEWWVGVFEIPSLVHHVTIFNRKDCCQSDLRNFAVTISSSRCARYNSDADFSIKTFDCNLFGADVKIEQMSTHVLTLCEVTVFGHVAELLTEQKRNYLGCYQDNAEDPDLSDFGEPVSVSTMHVNKCDIMCRRRRSKYFGLQNGMECWCGSSYGKHGKVHDDECKIECEGKYRQMCGGKQHNMIFELL